MKNSTIFRQCRILSVTALIICAVFMAPDKAQAYGNDFLEQSKHYSAMISGSDCIHFKLPVFSRGFNDYFIADRNSYVTYTLNGVIKTLFNYGGEYDNDSPNYDDDYSYGRAYIRIQPNTGYFEITNTSSGKRTRVPDDGQLHIYDVRKEREADNSKDYVTWLEVNWYIPEYLNEKTFKVSTHTDICNVYPEIPRYTVDVDLATDIEGRTNIMQPELYTPYFYGVVDQGKAGYGYAAIPFVTYNEPIEYTTSLDPNVVKVKNSSDHIFVPTNDTVQEKFYATFKMWRNKASGQECTRQTNKVDIPPYHRPYNFIVNEELDSTQTFTGRNLLSWEVKNPNLVDLVEGDFFEIQRAFKSDFSDAKAVDVLPMERGDDRGEYTYVDDSRATWTGNASSTSRGLRPISWGVPYYVLHDTNGAPLYTMTLEAESTPLMMPSVPVYYRVRRASSAVWGWTGHDFVLNTVCNKHNYLAPLAGVQPDYVKDEEYDTNRKVHFTIDIENREMHTVEVYDLNVKYEVRDYVGSRAESMPLEIVLANDPLEKNVRVVVESANGDILVDQPVTKEAIRLNVEYNSLIRLYEYVENFGAPSYYQELHVDRITSPTRCKVTAVKEETWLYDRICGYHYKPQPEYEIIGVEMEFDRVLPQLTDSLRNLMNNQLKKEYGTIGARAMWDKTAKLVLIKKTDETTNEIIIPQDSIRRLQNGNWRAYYTDTAEKACTQYSYAVRIDQSSSDLCVSDSAMLQPKEIRGPDLYFDESAAITQFTASQGSSVGENKRSVALNWTPSSTAVDSYILKRVEKGSDNTPEIIYSGVNSSFNDITAVPNVHYIYTVESQYECNGKHTSSSAEAEGWRSPYGEISGYILMPDNAGMSGVNVSLQGPDGRTLSTVNTDATGFYRFDNLTYDIQSGSNYTVVPTHEHAVFVFNNTTSPTAIVTLAVDNAVASAMNFTNTSTVRLSGRALYKNSTIPVADAMFLLNGDTVRCNSVPQKTGTDGNFELTLTIGQQYKLQIVKKGHHFEGDGILRPEEGKDTFVLDKPLDGVRFYDVTKVRLIGRVAGGNDQRELKHGFGLGTNNLGDDLQLVIQLEGDNTARFVFDPNDLTRDTVHQSVEGTETLFEQKRVTIHPDVTTGEYAVDLFPVKYKVIQATAKGYATLFAAGTGSESFDLTNAPLNDYTDTYKGKTIHYNAIYDRIYHTPVEIGMKQLIYGIEQDGFGEPQINVSSFNPSASEKLRLYTKQSDGTVSYTVGYPLFKDKFSYQFAAEAYEDYYYNNDRQHGKRDRVPQRGGSVTIHNGLNSNLEHKTYILDNEGKTRDIWIETKALETEFSGEGALHTLSATLEVEGNSVDTEVFKAFITGDIIKDKELHATEAGISLLDIIRDPGGNGSYTWVESGSTYRMGFKESYDFNAGLELTPTWGLQVSSDIGVITAPSGSGTYTGSTFTTKKEFSVAVPITHQWSWTNEYSYSVTTTDRVSTASKSNRMELGADNDAIVGANSDVFLGTTVCQVSGKAKSVSVINDSLFKAKQPALKSGTMKLLSQGKDAAGNNYYLVVAEKVVLGSKIGTTFAYSQYYIMENIIASLGLERRNLMMTFPDEATAQAAANSKGEEVYWFAEDGSYRMIIPEGSTATFNDRVAAIDNMMLRWVEILRLNEEQKVNAKLIGERMGTYSVSRGNTYSHSDTYQTVANHNELPQAAGTGASMAGGGAETVKSITKSLTNIKDFIGGGSTFGVTLSQALNKLFDNQDSKPVEQLGTVSNSSKFSMSIAPILDIDIDYRKTDERTMTKSTGFTIIPDDQGDITVSVYRSKEPNKWNDDTSSVYDQVAGNTDYRYGNYVFYTEAGSTFCMHEAEVRTHYYNPGTLISNSTMNIAKPEISIDTYEQTNVQPDQRAKFRVELRNAGEVPVGMSAVGRFFQLSLNGNSNPNGAKVYVNGSPLMQPIEYYIAPGEVVTQVMEVERGEVDDYNNLQLCFQLSDCPKNWSFLDFSVHYIPLSSDVSIESPRQNWVMNTLSQKDSLGYYLPVTISGFDIHHKNFDHIEFQYKLSTESDEMWVNQCSFFASDSLYKLASGNKAMIVNGRIEPFRFYGERDPMEQRYDLRAVSFCRYGSGFVSKASPVISGVKDTRPPKVFGSAQPADAILGVGSDLKLRFNEPIAGNYLDEDNNFQITGMTNATGINTGTSLHFNRENTSQAYTKVSRSLAGSSFSIDVTVRPGDNGGSIFKTLSANEEDAVSFFYDEKGALGLMVASAETSEVFYSKPGALTAGAFNRVVAVYDNEQKAVSFYVGTQQKPLSEESAQIKLPADFELHGSGPFRFGIDGESDMLEARVWLKALTQEEISATNMRYLTGYERDLLVYYRMNEGHGSTITDHANGATLYLSSTTWNQKKGISLEIKENQRATLDGNLLSRSSVQNESVMLWFKTSGKNGSVFSAGRTDEKHGTLLALEDGSLVLHNDSAEWSVGSGYDDGEWHHIAITVDRNLNNVSVFDNCEMKQSFSASGFSGISGAMYLGGNGFAGHIDDVVFFEQALPKTLIQNFDNISPVGDEMGIIGYLPFEQQILNHSGVLELVFSPNDRRIFYDSKGNVVDKVIPLITAVDGAESAKDMADKVNHAPTRDQGQLTKMKFDWAFNGDELLINLNMDDREINKQTIYLTVREVEDLNGNPMVSPVSWVAFVDRNALKWSERTLRVESDYDSAEAVQELIDIVNKSGRRHQYTIESLPDWLTVNKPYGSMGPQDELQLRLTFDANMPVGVYNDQIYLKDEDGLAEPLIVEYTVKAKEPYKAVDENKYPYNMSVCGQVKILTGGGDVVYDTDENDIVYAMYKNECVGMANVSFDNVSNKSDLYITIHGNKDMNGQAIRFQLWQSSTGKVFDLASSHDVTFAHGSVYGCGNEEPVVLVTNGNERQTIALSQGWNWTSFNLNLPAGESKISKVLTADKPWTDDDIIKNPATRHFVMYSSDKEAFVGDFDYLRHIYTYMIYSKNGNTMHVSGNNLSAESMLVTVNGDGKWSALPCLLKEVTPVAEALSDYYDNASPGDIIKSHNHFATFSKDRKWVGDLAAMRPGEGYFLRRMAHGSVDIHFYNKSHSGGLRRGEVIDESFTNAEASTNMTIIASVEVGQEDIDSPLNVMVDNELAGVAAPIKVDGEAYYFITVQSSKLGALQFEMDGEALVPAGGSINYSADSHHGSLTSPVVLKAADDMSPYKIIEDNQVIIIRGDERYDITGRKLNNRR